MTGVPGVDFPEGGLVDLLLASREDALIGWVESANDDMIVVTAGEDRSRRRVRIEAGEHVNVVWRAPEELRSRPTELVAVELEPQPVWRLRTAGPAARGQRRAWVRAPLAFPVWMSAGSAELGGMTVDISEGGARVLLNGSADTAAEKSPLDSTGTGRPAPPEDASAVAPPQAAEKSENTGPFTVGTVVDLTLWPDEEGLECRAELLRRIPRDDDRLEFTLRFIGIHEKTQDVIRRYVFAGLRQLRARGLI